MWGKIMIPINGCDYTAYMNYMDLTVRFPRKAIKFNHSITHSGASHASAGGFDRCQLLKSCGHEAMSSGSARYTNFIFFWNSPLITPVQLDPSGGVVGINPRLLAGTNCHSETCDTSLMKSETRNHLFNRCTYNKKINTWETNRWQGIRSIQLGIWYS